MKPIQRLKLTVKPKADFRGPIDLTVDNRTIAETIDAYFHETTGKPWPEKPRCYISTESLRASGTDGNYAILLCANCAQSGYPSCEDLGLLPIQVRYSEKTVEWLIGWAQWNEEAPPRPLRLVFDRSEYQRVLEKLSL